LINPRQYMDVIHCRAGFPELSLFFSFLILNSPLPPRSDRLIQVSNKYILTDAGFFPLLTLSFALSVSLSPLSPFTRYEVPRPRPRPWPLHQRKCPRCHIRHSEYPYPAIAGALLRGRSRIVRGRRDQVYDLEDQQ
jgi:hypothetical protein